MSRAVLKLFLVSMSLVAPSLGRACPLIQSRIDFNCDKRQFITFTGDSIVYGIGDEKGLHGYAGARLQIALKKTAIQNLGIPGITSRELLQRFKRKYQRDPYGEIVERYLRADIFVIAVGVNDFWRHLPVDQTVTNIRRLASFIRDKAIQRHGVAPYFVVATLAPTARVNEQPFVAALNRALLAASSNALPVLVRFDQLPTDILSQDGLHPSAAGYEIMEDVISEFIKGPAQQRMAALRSDRDRDGVYDELEETRFGTDPHRADTDGDGMSDGNEIFRFKTNPLLAD